MNILIIAGLYDFKFRTTIDPLLEVNGVDKIYLARRKPIKHKNVICYCPPKLIQGSVILGELYRIGIIFYLCLFKKINHIMGIHYYYHCVYTAICGLLFRKPYYFSIIENPKIYEKSWSFRFFLKWVKRVFVRGERSKNFLEEQFHLPSQKIIVLPDFFDFKKALEEASTDKDYDFVFTGRFVQDKRVDILLKALYQVKQRFPHVRVCLVGDGELRGSIETLIQELNLNDNIDLVGFQDDVYPYLRRSRIYTLTSETEGLPTSLIEAMACGLPSVVSDVGDNTDLAKHEVNALVCESKNVDQFAASCIRLLEDQKLYDKLLHNAQRINEEKREEYSIENVTTIYKEALIKDC